MISLGVKNLEVSKKFYQEGLGFPMLDSPPGVAFFNLNGSWLGLTSWESLAKDAGISAEGNGYRGINLAHNVKSKEEVSSLVNEAIVAGATVVKPPQKSDWGGFHAYFRDPDDHLWEIAYNPFFWVGPDDK